MILRLSKSEMLEHWLKLRRLNSAPLTGTIDRSDGADIMAVIQEEIDRWYYNLILSAPLRMLKVVNLASMLLVMVNDDNSATIVLPEEAIRLVNITVNTWHVPPKIVTDAQCRDVTRQRSPLTASTVSSPVVLKTANMLRLYPFDSRSSITLVSVVMLIDDVYEFDSLALSTIIPNDTDFTF